MTSENVIHCVEAGCQTEAESILVKYYIEKNDSIGPYGDRYWVENVKSFPPLSLADLKR